VPPGGRDQVPAIDAPGPPPGVGAAGPIGADRLTADGVLREAGGWYEVLDPAHLPEHALPRIEALKPATG
jgi:hypothetical protein